MAPSVLPGANDHEKLQALAQLTYKEQAVWFLNAFWDTLEKEGETLWNYVIVNAELDLENHEEGCGLDEMKAHVFLEKFDETLTVREMRAKLRSTGAIGEAERPKTVPLTHFLLYKYAVDWHTLTDETLQGDNKEEMAKAEKMLEEVAAAVKQSESKAATARKALAEAQSAENAAKERESEAVASENAAKQREAEAKQQEANAKSAAEQSKVAEAKAKEDAEAAKAREEEAKAAQKELEAALAELEAEEKAYNDKKEMLKKKSEEGGVVSRNKAANELAQLLSEDPLPLRRAKITQEAAVKKAEKATNAAASAREAAEKSAAAASKARKESEEAAANATSARQQAEKDAQAATAAAKASAEAKQAADAALDDARRQLEEAEVFLEEVKSRPGQAFGALWWIDRELHEQKKYLPESKGGIRKN